MEKNNSGKSLNGMIIVLVMGIVLGVSIGFLVFSKSKENANIVESSNKNQAISEISNTNSNVVSEKEANNSNSIINELEEDNNSNSITSDLEKENNSNSITNDLEKEDNSSNLITDELDEDEIFCVTSAKKNSDNTYTLKGVVYTRYTATKDELNKAAENGLFVYNGIEYSVKKDYEMSKSTVKYDYAFFGEFNGEERLEYVAKDADDDIYYINNITEFEEEWKLTDDSREFTVDGDVDFEGDIDTVKVSKYFEEYEERTAEKTSHPSGCVTFEFDNGKCSKVIEYTTGH